MHLEFLIVLFQEEGRRCLLEMAQSKKEDKVHERKPSSPEAGCKGRGVLGQFFLPSLLSPLSAGSFAPLFCLGLAHAARYPAHGCTTAIVHLPGL